ncbi:iron-sulfur cluster-binding oxidoreductase [Geobacter sp. FeAm09]|uniref:iron-sulfur cluster-binding oxidoreductase n=1 Tax=Geobacter sp. FeAm09 TaxID=2597769 RepID=UPI0011EEF58F|nr:iron-sulfur cluster-binding oxidoreductase [Geobacter sp. FeAm09]QEM68699.1 iron-sulfur cluster-binding oxidoreductase [Geobacter sp. FeAm09]
MAHPGCGCPGSAARIIEQPASHGGTAVAVPSELRQWPVQLHLVPPTAPYFQNADLLISADCVAYAMGGMHQDLLKGKALAIACPKLDDTTPYGEKLAAIFSANAIRSITVAIMEVPCCRGLDIMVREALARSGREIPLESVVIGVNGERRN